MLLFITQRSWWWWCCWWWWWWDVCGVCMWESWITLWCSCLPSLHVFPRIEFRPWDEQPYQLSHLAGTCVGILKQLQIKESAIFLWSAAFKQLMLLAYEMACQIKEQHSSHSCIHSHNIKNKKLKLKTSLAMLFSFVWTHCLWNYADVRTTKTEMTSSIRWHYI